MNACTRSGLAIIALLAGACSDDDGGASEADGAVRPDARLDTGVALDTGVDAGTDAAPDATPDSGSDAGPGDSGLPDAAADGGPDADGGSGNRAPVAAATSTRTGEENEVFIEVAVTDDGVDDGGISFVEITPPEHGVVDLPLALDVFYTPEVGFIGVDTFEIAPTDGIDQGAPVTITVTVTEGTRYYVSPSGDDMNNGTSVITPLATLGEATDRIDSDEDEILMLQGVHTSGPVSLPAFDLDIRGAFSDPTRTVIDFDDASASIDTGDSTGTLRDLTVRGSASHCLRMRGDWTLSNVHVTRCRDSGIQISNGGNVTLERVELVDNESSSNVGGAIRAEGGDLIIRDSLLEGNQNLGMGNGAGVWINLGSLTIERSRLIDNETDQGRGGAIHSSVEIVIRDSLVRGNAADDGGAIWTTGPLYIERSLFESNTATGQAGAIRLNGGGNALIVSSTFVDHEGGELGSVFAGAGFSRFRLAFVTIANNRAASGAPADLPVLGDFAPYDLSYVLLDNPGIDDCGPGTALQSVTESRSSDTSCNDDDFPPADQGVDPLLGPLAANGGPTDTLLPEPTSPALDVITPVAGACPSPTFVEAVDPYDDTDQRGTARPVGSACDLGAVEQ